MGLIQFGTVSAVIWSIVWSYSPWEAIWLAFLMILRDFLATGLCVASILWFVQIIAYRASARLILALQLQDVF